MKEEKMFNLIKNGLFIIDNTDYNKELLSNSNFRNSQNYIKEKKILYYFSTNNTAIYILVFIVLLLLFIIFIITKIISLAISFDGEGLYFITSCLIAFPFLYYVSENSSNSKDNILGYLNYLIFRKYFNILYKKPIYKIKNYKKTYIENDSYQDRNFIIIKK